MGRNTVGEYISGNNKIRLNNNRYRDLVELVGEQGANEYMAQTIRHELQHAIQDIEGSEGGSSKTYWSQLRKDAADKLKSIDNQHMGVLSMAGVTDEYDNEHFLDEDYEDNVERMVEEAGLTEINNRLMAEFDKWADILRRTDADLYENTVGEIEARAASNNGAMDFGRAVRAEDYGLAANQSSQATDAMNAANDSATAAHPNQMSIRDMTQACGLTLIETQDGHGYKIVDASGK